MEKYHVVDDINPSPQICCNRARQLWLEACDQITMKKVEQLYRYVWIRYSPKNSENNPNDSLPMSKKVKLGPENSSDADSFWRQHAGEKLALILLQSNREAEADRILLSLGYSFRLANSVMNHQYPASGEAESNDNHDEEIPCRIYDNFIQVHELNMLISVFSNPASSYWIDHNYAVEPPSPYFSYLIPLQTMEKTKIDPGIVSFVRRLQFFLESYYAVKSATYCEMWAHNRPHATGHQFHFDSDNEGCTKKIRNPICSCVVYLSDDVGGPSVITNQRLASQNLASVGWISFPTFGRLLVFDGKVLHGVIPGRGFCPTSIDNEIQTSYHHRRVSVMFAFWSKIRVRDKFTKAGAAKLLPETPFWAQQLLQPLDKAASIICEPIEVQPIKLDHVYVSTISGKPWSRGMGLPDYEDIFQGF